MPLGDYEVEVSLAHAFLAPSSFVKESLFFAGAQEGDVHLCPYGSNFAPASAVRSAVASPMHFVFCGRMIPNKGIHRIFQAFDMVDPDSFQLTLAGGYNNDDGFFDDYLNRYDFKGLILHDQVEELYRASDVMVFPSMIEGMSLACLEALGCGHLDSFERRIRLHRGLSQWDRDSPKQCRGFARCDPVVHRAS